MDRFATNHNPWSKRTETDWLWDMEGPATPVVCILSNVRRGPYWVDVATSGAAMDSLARNHTLRRRMKGEAVSESDVVLPVWYAACECMAEAERRAEDLRRWSPLWQRSLIERMNPQWLDLGAMAIGLPIGWVTALPEEEGMPHRAVSAL